MKMIISADEEYPVFDLFVPDKFNKHRAIDVPDEIVEEFETVERQWIYIQAKLRQLYDHQ